MYTNCTTNSDVLYNVECTVHCTTTTCTVYSSHFVSKIGIYYVFIMKQDSFLWILAKFASGN